MRALGEEQRGKLPFSNYFHLPPSLNGLTSKIQSLKRRRMVCPRKEYTND